VRIADVILRLSPRQSWLIGKEAIRNIDHGKHEEHFQHGGKICYKGKCYYLMLQETFCPKRTSLEWKVAKAGQSIVFSTLPFPGSTVMLNILLVLQVKIRNKPKPLVDSVLLNLEKLQRTHEFF
jgi:hypothetical protein